MHWLLSKRVFTGASLAVLALAGCSSPEAPQQPSRLGSIRNYDIHKTYEGSGFNADKSVSTASSRVQPFQYRQRQATKGFATEPFAGGKGYDSGAFDTNPSQFSSQSAKETEQVFATTQAPVNEDPDANKGANTQGEYATQAFAGKGKSQEELGREGTRAAGKVGWRGKLKQMTLDEVRELLNKSK